MKHSQSLGSATQQTDFEIQRIKNKLIVLLYWILAIFLWFALAASLYRTLEFGFKWVNYIQFVLSFIVLVVFVLQHKIKYAIKTWIILGVFYILGSAALFTYGLRSQSAILFLLFTVLTHVLVNNSAGIAAFGLTFLTFVIAAVIFIISPTHSNVIITDYNHYLSAWVVAIIIYSMVTIIIILLWKRIAEFLLTKILKTQTNEENLIRVNKMLIKEIDSRKSAEEQLNVQFDEIKSLNQKLQVTNVQLHEANAKLEQSNKLIKEAQERVQIADNLKTSLLSNISHEIRTPLNAIMGFSALIANEDINADERKNYYNIIQSSSTNLLGTITDIVNMAKIESGQYTLYPETLNLNKFIDDLSKKYTQEVFNLKGEKVKFSIENTISHPCTIIVDTESLNQITTKIIDNAIKFTDAGFVIVRFTLTDNGYLTFMVQDSGIGISDNIKINIFETFRQIDAGNTRKYGGFGLGLSITKGLINLLNGTIEFVPNDTKGITFNVAIPIILFNKENTHQLNREKSGTNHRTVLVIGKDSRENRLLNTILQEYEAILFYVETGFQAIETVKEQPNIDFIILSSKLPVMQTSEVTKMIKKNSPNIPLLLYNTSNIDVLVDGHFINGIITPILSRDEIMNILKKTTNL